MTPQQSINSWEGKIDDTDGVPKGAVYQCVDRVKRHLNQVYGLPMLAYGNAADYWDHTNPLLLTKFERVPPQQLQPGDIPIFKRKPANGNGGHIGIAQNATLFQSQNYGTGNGDGKGLNRIRLAPIPYNDLLGILRPEGVPMQKTTKFMEDVCSRMATGSIPGPNYDYRWTNKDLTENNVNDMLVFWLDVAEKQPKPTGTCTDEERQLLDSLNKLYK